MKVGVALWETVQFEGSRWQVVALDAGAVALRSLDGLRPRTATVAALLTRPEDGPLEAHRVPLLRVSAFDTAPAAARAQAGQRAAQRDEGRPCRDDRDVEDAEWSRGSSNVIGRRRRSPAR